MRVFDGYQNYRPWMTLNGVSIAFHYNSVPELTRCFSAVAELLVDIMQ